jgi:hypothetical protein
MRPNEALERLDELFCGPNKLPAVVLVVDEVRSAAPSPSFLRYPRFSGPSHLTRCPRRFVLKIDQLATRDNSVLYRLFCWPQQPNSSVILLSIANALDLTGVLALATRKAQCDKDQTSPHGALLP